MKIALLQYNVGEDIQSNTELVQNSIREYADQGIHLFILPELCLSSYGMDLEESTFTEESSVIKEMGLLAKEMRAHIMGSFCILDQGQRHNRLLCWGPDGLEGRRDKQRLFSYWQEHEKVGTGPHCDELHIAGWRVAPFICYELRFPELFRQHMGAELMVVMAQWPLSRREHWMALLKARAIENQSYVVGVNRIGRSAKDIAFAGTSLVFDPKGEKLFEASVDEFQVKIMDLDLDSLVKYRQSFPALADAKPVICEK